MGYYADLIKEKRNSKYSYNLVKKGEDKWVIQTKYGGKTVDEQEFYGTEEAAKRKGENNVRYFESRNEKDEKENYDRKESAYKTALSLWRKKKPVKEIVSEMMGVHHFSKDESYIALDKVANDEKHRERAEIMKKAGIKNSKGENMNYYAKIIAEKRNGKMNADDKPFTKKQECVSTLDRIISLAQRKKSQVQGWRTIDEDFDENEFASDLRDALRAVENIIG